MSVQAGRVQQVTDLLAHLDGETADTDLVLDSVTAELSRLRPGTWLAAVMERDPSTSRVVIADHADPARAAGVDRHLANLHKPGRLPTTGLFLRVIETSRPVLMPDISFEQFLTLLTDAEASSRMERPISNSDKSVGLLLMPMRARTATIGVLGLLEWDRVGPVSDRDIPWMQQVADRVGVVLENAHISSAASERLVRLTAIRNAAFIMSSSQDLAAILEGIAKQAAIGLRVDAAILLRVDDRDGLLTVAAATGFRFDAKRINLDSTPKSADSTTYDHSVEALKGFDATWLSRHRSLLAREGFKDHRWSPVKARGRTLGILEVFHRSDLEPDEEWIAFLDLMATNAAIAIVNSSQEPHGPDEGPGPAEAAAMFSSLQRQILRLVVEGATNREIGAKLHLSDHTIKYHVRHILEKAGAANRTELARISTQSGWL